MMYCNGMLMMAFMTIPAILLIVTVLLGLVWLVRSTGVLTARGRPDTVSQTPEAELLLRRRYAAGEIDDEEYQRRLAALRGQPSAPT
ncbi:hypothetical protein E1193_01875 [Micromonospora sp. KC606]|uniref:SHOCT domain-containing protein n=1 Tax=Micromonospora sp. KC606 TaxID=2530379 RepID=UPI00104C8608|nr:SHOCT domain-containing protein [Micromonospora sp. KC606]TDC85812.1 hypothetical protein E1193_01875 [Micromonospora sp. KC606]